MQVAACQVTYIDLKVGDGFLVNSQLSFYHNILHRLKVINEISFSQEINTNYLDRRGRHKLEAAGTHERRLQPFIMRVDKN